MQNTKEKTNITTAKEQLEDTLTYFMEMVSAYDASDGLLTLLCEMPPEVISTGQQKAVHALLQVVNAISRVQVAESTAHPNLSFHLKIA